MNKKLIPFILLLSAGTLFASDAHTHEHANCTHDHAAENHNHTEEVERHEHDHDEAQEKEHADAPVPITISQRARESIAMRTEKISSVPATNLRSYYGQIIVPASAQKTAAIPAAGRIRFFVKVGETVRAGEPLFSLSSPTLIEMRSDVLDAEAALERARSELKTLQARLAKLEEIEIKNSELESSIRFKEAEIKTLATAAQRSINLWNQATLGAEFKNNKLIVPARYDGNIQSIDMNEGAWGEQGAPALTYIASGELEFKASIYGNDSLSGASARLVLTLGGKTNYFAGTLRVATQIAEDSQTRTIYFLPEKLPPEAFAGQVARLEIFTPEELQKDFLLVPNSAVIKVGIDNIVFVCDAENPNKFIAIKVKTLPSRRGMTPVHGVPANATIVTKGGYELKYVLPSTAGTQKKAAGHFHADGKFHEGEH